MLDLPDILVHLNPLQILSAKLQADAWLLAHPSLQAPVPARSPLYPAAAKAGREILNALYNRFFSKVGKLNQLAWVSRTGAQRTERYMSTGSGESRVRRPA